MSKEGTFEGNLSYGNSSFDNESQPDAETLVFKNLFDSLVKKHGSRDFVMKQIERDTLGTAPKVVNNWLRGEIPSRHIRNGIVRALVNLRNNPPMPEAPKA